MNKLANSYYLSNKYSKSLDLIDKTIVLAKEKNLQNEEEKALELKLKVLNSSSKYKYLGIATADNTPKIIITIINSIKVNPFLFFSFFMSFSF